MNTTVESAVIIRTMLPSDLEHIIRIEREIFLFPWSPGNFADSLKSGYHCRVLTQAEAILGYGIMMMSPAEAHILTLGIAAHWQNKGLGKKMLCHLIDHARSDKAEAIFLDVRESNHGAAQLYMQLGFKQIATRKGYYPAMCGREDARVMQLLL